MDKITYLAELAEALARWVPERERQDILRYYAEYFEEAGPEREAEVVQELGDPWALASRLAVEGGYVTQEAANSWTPPKKRKTPLFVLAGVAIVAIVAITSASFFARVGRLVGQAVGRSMNQTTVVEDYAVAEAVPGMVFYEIDGEASGGGFWSMEDGYLEPLYAMLVVDTIDATREKLLPIYMKSVEDRLLTKKEVCLQLGIGETSVWNLTKRGRLTAVKVGKSVRYRQSEVTEILNSTND